MPLIARLAASHRADSCSMIRAYECSGYRDELR
jgi:hypothetical protein